MQYQLAVLVSLLLCDLELLLKLTQLRDDLAELGQQLREGLGGGRRVLYLEDGYSLVSLLSRGNRARVAFFAGLLAWARHTPQQLRQRRRVNAHHRGPGLPHGQLEDGSVQPLV